MECWSVGLMESWAFSDPDCQHSTRPVLHHSDSSVRALDAEGLAEFGGTYNLGSDVRAAVHRMQMRVAIEAFRGDHRKVRIVFEHPPMEEYVARSGRSSAALT